MITRFFEYRVAIGQLLHLATKTRADIRFAVRTLSQHVITAARGTFCRGKKGATLSKRGSKFVSEHHS